MSVRPVAVMTALFLALSVVRSGAVEETTETRLAKFGKDLAAAWASYPTEKDAVVRKQKSTDLNLAMTSEITKLSPPEDLTVQKALDNFLGNLQKARGLFKQDKMAGDRQQYVSMCAVVFRRELSSATDLKDERSANKCFEKLVEWCDAARTGLHSVPEDAHQPYYGGLSEAFTQMLKSAVKDAEDPTTVYDKQLKEVKRRFPVTGVFEKTNRPVVTILETAAKTANTFNKK